MQSLRVYVLGALVCVYSINVLYLKFLFIDEREEGREERET